MNILELFVDLDSGKYEVYLFEIVVYKVIERISKVKFFVIFNVMDMVKGGSFLFFV